MKVLIFSVVLLAVFGPKLFGFVDLSIMAGAFGFAVIFPGIRAAIVPRELAVIASLLAVIVAHTIVVTIVYGNEELYPLLRHTRALSTTLFLAVVFYWIGRSRQISVQQFLDIILVCLTLNAVTILAQIYWPGLKPPLADLVGFDKHFVGLRGFGLTAGYDTAGYLCVFGSIMSAMCAYRWAGAKYQVLLLVFLSACLFTSRSTMVLAFAIATIVICVYILKGRVTLRINATVLGSAVLTAGAVYVLPLLAATFAIFRALGVNPESGDVDFVASFATTELGAWRDRMWILPVETAKLLFGSGDRAPQSDIGYVKIVHMVGIVGFSVVLAMYFTMFTIGKRIWNQRQLFRNEGCEGISILASCVCLFIALFLVINIKNLYFLTRGYHELIVILVFFGVGTRDVFAAKQAIEPRCVLQTSPQAT